MKIKLFLQLLIVTVAAASCEKTVYVDIPDNDPKLVIFSFLQRGTDSVFVSVTKSVPLYSNYQWGSSNAIKDALVSITQNGKKTPLVFSQSTNPYFPCYKAASSNFAFAAGEQFKVEVEAEGQKKSVTCIYPDDPKYQTEVVMVDSLPLEYSDEYQYSYFVKFTSQNADAENYYYFQLMGYGHPYWNSGNLDSTVIYGPDASLSYYKFKKDEPKILKFSSDFLLDSLSMRVYKIDKDYYHYGTSVNKNNNDSPFTEPVPVYTNIEGGLGLVTAINRGIKKTIFKRKK